MNPKPHKKPSLLKQRSVDLIKAMQSTSPLVNLEEMTRRIPALGGNPQRTLIVAAWRTGSTFLSQLLASNLKDMRYFVYEPLMAQFRIHVIKDSLQQQQALQLLQKIFHCEYNQINDERHYVLNAMYLQNAPLWRTMWNTTREKAILARLQNWSKEVDVHKRIPLSGRVTNVLRSHQRLVRNYCSIYPHQIIKLVRLPLSALENLLENDKYALIFFVCLSILYCTPYLLNQQIIESLRNSFYCQFMPSLLSLVLILKFAKDFQRHCRLRIALRLGKFAANPISSSLSLC